MIFGAEEVIREFDEVNSLHVKGRFQVSLIKSDKNSVKITPLSETADPELIQTEMEGDQLMISISKKSFVDKDYHITVYYKEIHQIQVQNEAEVLTEPENIMKLDSIELTCTLGGKIHVQLEVKKVNITIKQGGSIKLKGTADGFDGSIFTGGRISGSEFIVKEATILIKMGGEINIHPLDYLNVKIFSGGTVRYKGDPKKVDQDIKVSGTVSKIK